MATISAHQAAHQWRNTVGAQYPARRERAIVPSMLAVLAISLAGCSDSLPSLPKLSDINPFAEKQVPLPGKRIPVLEDKSRMGADLAAADRPLTFPAPSQNDGWTQPGGSASNAFGHLALNASVRQIWSQNVGSGSNKYGKLTAQPLMYDGKIFVLDAAGQVTALSASGGSTVWRVSLTPEKERSDKGFGGGLAIDNGRLYAATGFGTVVALDPKSGKSLWTRVVGVPLRMSPTATQDRVFVTTTEGELVSLNGSDGAENWRYRGLPEKASIISNASPAIEGDVVVAPFASGEVVALKLGTGEQIWSENLSSSGASRTMSALASLTDAARPVVDSGIAYATGHGGRTIATSVRSGERLWSASLGGIQQPWVAGEAVFVADTNGQLAALTRRDGKVAWSVKLPGTNAKWSGPVLAGGKLWVVSSTGSLVSVEATTGKIASTLELGTPVFIAPIVAQGRMYVLTDKATLIALQ